MEIWTIFLLFFLCLALGFGGWLIFLWAVKTDQFEDLENQKYRIFDDEED
ncbi:MAG: cbb3-type cytochrome oxidase assembly protein CcoS [Candidatus Schekmanbacteria bacterium]|nr:cbb3-type cytochrome oxidase assembly protein CcoS [Candidatus Schekmanbacteria bacterium]